MKHIYRGKRIFDFIVALIGLILLAPLFLIISILIKLDSKGPIFYIQKRAGYKGKEFNMIKFRTMYQGAEKAGYYTIGHKDPRVTKIGYFLRKYKLDELPQLINVLKGDMSIVGPRPDLKYRIEQLPEELKKIYYSQKPGITSYASIKFINEPELIAKQGFKTGQEVEDFLVRKILPEKMLLNKKYLEENPTIFTDIKIILKTLFRLLKL